MPPKAPSQIYSFAAGVLDPTARGRMDLKSYYAGAKTGLNVTPHSLGGMGVRGGFRKVVEVPEAAGGARLGTFKYSMDAAYLLLLTDAALKIMRADAQVAALSAPWTAAQLETLDWSQSQATMVLTHPDMKTKRLLRQGSHTAWAIDDAPLTNIPTHKFDGSTAEAVWSATRGWPISVLFHQGRTYFGGARELKDTMWGSNAGEYWDFEEKMVSSTDQTPLDDTRVSAALGGGGGQDIRRMLATDDLFVFSDGGAWSVSSSTEAIKPDTFLPLLQSEVRASTVRPCVVEGSVVYLSAADDGAHSSLHELTWDDQAQGYYARDLALRCPSLLRSPVDMAVRLSADGTSAATMMVVNGDGTMAVLTPNRFENITAWTLWRIEGEILAVAVVINTVYVLTRRTIAGETRYFIERQDSNARLDCSTLLTAESPQADWGGLDYLEGQTVNIIGDGGAVVHTATVTDGAVSLPVAVSSIEVGLAFDWEIEPMPPEVQLADGTLVGHSYRIHRVSVRLYETRGLSINGRFQPLWKFRQMRFDQLPDPYTGVVSRTLLGWGKDYSVRFHGSSVLPATVLSCTLEITQ